MRELTDQFRPLYELVARCRGRGDAVDAAEQEFKSYLPLLERAATDGLEDDAWFQRTLYLLNIGCLHTPWARSPDAADHPVLVHLRAQLANCYRRSLRRASGAVERHDNLPAVVEALSAEYGDRARDDLFAFLERAGTIDDFREFILQESPMDMAFADYIASMLPGVYGPEKREILKNYVDEMGGDYPDFNHRVLRLQLMAYLGVGDDAHYADIPSLMTSELALANLYYLGALSRSMLPHLVGVILATEVVVPNRVAQLARGLRRLGAPESVLTYLNAHVVIDAKHASDWLERVVAPIVGDVPACETMIIEGMKDRLFIATRVSAELLAHPRRTGALPADRLFESATC